MCGTSGARLEPREDQNRLREGERFEAHKREKGEHPMLNP